MCAEETVVRVVMPLHDKRGSVLRAVNAVLGQTWRGLELVVVDDGSTDGGVELLATIADPRLRVLRTERRGPGAARNTGARDNRAPWLAFVDADDEWQPTFLEKALAAARSAPQAVLVFCDVHARGRAPRRLTIGSGTLGDYYEARLRHRISVSSSSNLIRSEHFAAIGGFPEDYRYAEDIETWLRLTCRGPFYFIAEPLCMIELGAGDTITRVAHPLERAAGLQRLFESFVALERSGAIRLEHVPACRRFMQHQRGRQALHLAAAGHRLQALRVLSRVPLNSHTWLDWAICVARVLLPRAAR